MSTAQAPAQAVEVCFDQRRSRRRGFVRPQGERIWRDWSVPRIELAIKRGSITLPGLVDAPVVVRASLED